MTQSRSATALGPFRPGDVAGRQSLREELLAQEVRVGHAERVEDVLAQVAIERYAADLLDDLAERGVAVVRVGKRRARVAVTRRISPR